MEKKITINNEGKFLVNGVVQEDAFVGTLDGVARLFVDGVAVKGTLKELGLREEIYAISTNQVKNLETGETVTTAVRPNGDIAITVINSNGEIVPEKCKEIKK